METHKSQLKIGIILAYLATGVNIIVHLVYTPVMIRLLGQSEYGVYTYVGSVVTYLSLFNLGFTGAYLRFYSRYAAKGDKEGVASLNGMFLTVFTTMSLIALAAGMVLVKNSEAVFGSKITPDEQGLAKILLAILVVNVALTFPQSLFTSMTSAHERFLFQRALQLAGAVFNPLICLPLLLMGYGSIAVVSVTTAITIATLLTNIYYCLFVLKVPFAFRGFQLALLLEIASFSFFIFLNMIIDQANWSVDKFILGRTQGSGAVAVYGVGAQINNLYTMFSTSISSVFAPRVNMIAARNENRSGGEFTDLFIKVGRAQFLVSALICTGFIFFGEYFITNIYASAEYRDAYPVALLLIITVTIPLIQNLGLEIQRSLNKHKFRSVVYTFMAILNVFVSIYLARRYGPIGAALGTAVSLIVANGLIMNAYYHKAIGIDIIKFWKNILSQMKGLIIPSVLGVFIMKFIHFKGFLDFVLWVVIYTVVYGISVYLLSMDESEKVIFSKPVKKLLRR